MIEIFLNIIVAILIIVIIWFLIQYGLEFRQERLKQEDIINKIKEQEYLEQRTKEHQNKLANGYKYYEWRGEETWVYRYTYTQEVHRREKRLTSGEGYYKSEDDLRNCLNAEWITLTWFREL